MSEKERKKQLKAILKGYRRMNKGIRRALEELGIHVETTGGNHYKLYDTVQDKFVIMSKTPSDTHVGLYTAMELCRKNKI